MTKASRSRFIAGTAASVAAAALVRYPAGAAEFTFKLSNAAAADHPTTLRANEAAARLLQESGGRVEVRVFPNSALGKEEQIISKIH